MKPIVQNVIAVALGLIIGATTITLVEYLGVALFPPPEGVDTDSAVSISENLHLYSTWQMMPPLLAYAIGTLVGAFVTAFVAAKSKLALGLAIAGFFMTGGAAMLVTIKGMPLWFILTNMFSYLPMGAIGGWFGQKVSASYPISL